MKPFNYLSLAGITILILTFSCENETEKLIFSGKMVSSSDCKSLKSNAFVSTSDSLSCAEYSYNEARNKLFIKHINAGFQCGADSLYCIVDISNDTIVIQEFDTPRQNDCYCLYDLEIQINGVESRKYHITFIEPERGNQEQISFGVDFSSQKKGSFCVERNRYPWGK